MPFVEFKLRRLGLMLLCLALPLGADGLRSYELGARAAALGGAFVARADDVSAVFYNPAGLAFLPGLRLKINVHYTSQSLAARAAEEGSGTMFRLNPVRTSAFVSYGLKGRFSLGLGVFSSQAWDVRWPDYWPYNQTIVRNSLHALSLRCAAAVRILDSLSLGVGLEALDVRQSWTWNNPGYATEDFPYYYGRESIAELKGTAWSFSLGCLFAPWEKLRIGARYQHGASLDLGGEHYLEGVGVQKAGLSVVLPAEWTLGFRFQPLSKLVLEMDARWTDWSMTSAWRLVLGPQVSGMWGAVLEDGERTVSSAWGDTLSLMFGAEYALSSAIFLRAGYGRLPAAVPADGLHPFAPDLEDHVFSLGAGYEGPFYSIATAERLGDMSVDLFLQYHDFRDEVSALSGFPLAYSASRLTLGAAIGFIF